MSINDEMARQTNERNTNDLIDNLRARIAASEQRNRNLLYKLREQDDDVDRSNADYTEMCRSVLEELGYNPDEPGLDVLPDEAATRVREERDRLREDNQTLQIGLDAAVMLADEAMSERDRLREVVRDVEWVEWVPGNGEAQCPSCMAFAAYDEETNAYEGQHHKDCALRAALEVK